MAETILDVFNATARAHAARPAMARKQPDGWQRTSWSGYHDAVRQAARSLLALGVERCDGVAILSANRPEWFVANQAAIAIGARPAGIYTNSTPEQCRYIAEHAEAAVAFVDGPEALARLEGAGRPGGLKAVVQMDGPPARGALGWQEFLALGGEAHEAEVARRSAAARGADVCTLIYTSGTTGAPKAVMLTHRNLVFIAERAREIVPVAAVRFTTCSRRESAAGASAADQVPARTHIPSEPFVAAAAFSVGAAKAGS